jgi:thiaminase/transcriptional activator TenA
MQEQGAAPSAHPYAEWICLYGGVEYQSVAGSAMDFLDRLGSERGGMARYQELLTTFRAATRLEAAFWDMALAEHPSAS